MEEDDATPPEDDTLESFYGRDDIFGFKPQKPLPKAPPKKARTATGALLTGIALGLRDVFDPEKKTDTIAIEQEAPGEPHEPGPVDLHFDPNDRGSTYVVIRRPPPPD